MKITVETLTPDHLVPMMDDIRPEDYREWYAGTGSADIAACLQPVFEERRYARAAVGEDGKALLIWGADDLSRDGTASVWLVATSTAERHAISLHRALRQEVPDLLTQWEKLEAWSDSRNTRHHTWLEWLGFEFQREDFLQPLGLPFKLYTIRRPTCASRQH